jgi:hypothetical protein
MKDETLFTVEQIKKNIIGYNITSNIELLEEAYNLVTALRKELGETLALHRRSKL